MKTLEQERSNYAFDSVSKIKGKPFEKDASSLISKLGTLILTNGLGNTLERKRPSSWSYSDYFKLVV